jgi:LuxR family maltose regulon positive regulatory protein
VPDFFPDVRPIGAVRARLWTRLGRAADTLAWAREGGLGADDEPGYPREYEHITLAGALVDDARARADLDAAREVRRFVDRLLEAAVAGGRGRSVIELLVLRALACGVARDRDGAAAALDRALVLAQPERLARAFLDHGPAIEGLLRDAVQRAAAPAFAGHLLAVVEGSRVVTPRPHGLVEPLSERELEVLRLLASDLDGPEVAARLYVSLNTLRTHTRHIFGKLGVNSRRAAVTRAAELGILARRQ